MTMFLFNLQPRLVWCRFCKTESITDKPKPICEGCGGNLITALFSHSTGECLTSEEISAHRKCLTGYKG